jgi:ABC-type phosphate/phosphonate transport system substrate-binding protein
MSDRLYCADIIKCEDFLYEDMDTLIEYARQNTSEFITYTDFELVEIKHGDDGLEITYKVVDDYDEDDNEVIVTKTESFEIEYPQMMVTVRLPNFKVA